jgi:hypothetical protein
MRRFLLLATLAVLSGCGKGYDEGLQAGRRDGYEAGFEAGKAAAQQRLVAECDQRLSEQRESYTLTSPVVSTTVCGGNGLVLNGKHIPPGKTGCVAAMSDGTVRRY